MAELCSDCLRPECRRDAVEPYKSVDRLRCYEVTILRLRADLTETAGRMVRALMERDQYAHRLEIEQRDHEVTKGYRAHAEQLLADEQRAHLATKGYLAPERPLEELIAEELREP